MVVPQAHGRGTDGNDVPLADRAVVAGLAVLPAATLEQVRTTRRRVRLNSGRPDGRCGKVAEALRDELGWAYRWGHLRLLDGEMCWIHCWNQLPDGTIVDATADQFEERWLGGETGVAVLRPGDPQQANYHPAPPGHLFRTALAASRVGREDRAGHRRLFARRGTPNGAFEANERQLAIAPATEEGWAALGACAVQVHSGWMLPEWIGQEAGEQLGAAEAAGQPLPSRELEFALDAATWQRRIASHDAWTSPEWRDRQARQVSR